MDKLAESLDSLLKEAKAQLAEPEAATEKTASSEPSHAPTDVGIQLRKLASVVRDSKVGITYEDLNKVLGGSDEA
jgi:hypothetical protein